jgi:hypothetical protein
MPPKPRSSHFCEGFGPAQPILADLAGFRAQRKAHWPGAAASGVPIKTRLNRLPPVQCSGKLCTIPVIAAAENVGQPQNNTAEHTGSKRDNRVER